MHLIRKVLIVNRGEIARRIIRTARRMGIKTVALWMEDDRDLQYIQDAHESVCFRETNLDDTFLNIDRLLSIAQSRNCDAIHPGYGFLSENPAFARRCHEAGIVWIGPSPAAMELLSNKIEATQLAASLDIPTIPTVTGNAEELISQCEAMPYPLLIKAASGGGGRGMKIVWNRNELGQQLTAAAFEAMSYFGNDHLFVTPYFEQVRHIEVQIVADQWGNVIHLYDRECSIQRRYQKIVEEAPCVSVSSSIREKIWTDAVKLAQKAGYNNVGTVEFIVLPSGKYYFLEVNTRIQVEHPVTETITGIDIVECQIRAAQGEKLPWQQEEITVHGHAIECRICAEDPANHFFPAGGEIHLFHTPQYSFLRVEADVKNGQAINLNFDSLLAKIIVHAYDRRQAIERMNETLNQSVLLGTSTNIPLLRVLFKNSDFQKNAIYTTFLEQQLPILLQHIHSNYALTDSEAAFLATCAFVNHEHRIKNLSSSFSQWYGRWRILPHLIVRIGHDEKKISYAYHSNHDFLEVSCNEQSYRVNFTSKADEENFFEVSVTSANRGEEFKHYAVYFAFDSAGRIFIETDGKKAEAIILNRFLNTKEHIWTKHDVSSLPLTDFSCIVAPIPGKIAKIFITEGQKIQQGDLLAVIESMKTENKLTALNEGIIEEILVKTGETVKVNQILFTLNKN